MFGYGILILMMFCFCGLLKGDVIVSGDKLILYWFLILGVLVVGEIKILGLLEGEDVIDIVKVMCVFGVEVVDYGGGDWFVFGVGVGGFVELDQVIDCGNFGIGVCLIMGCMVMMGIMVIFMGDVFLNKCLMVWVIDLIVLFGVQLVGCFEGCLLMIIVGVKELVFVCYMMFVFLVQVKFVVLLVVLNVSGQMVVIEKEVICDYIEWMLVGFGVEIFVCDMDEGCEIILMGQLELVV